MTDTMIIRLIVSLVITISVYSLPIIIYRFAIIRHPVERKKANVITTVWAILSLVIMGFLMSTFTGEAVTGGGLLLWSFVNYSLLTGGKNSDPEPSPITNEPEQTSPVAEKADFSQKQETEYISSDSPRLMSTLTADERRQFHAETKQLKNDFAMMKYTPEQMYATIKRLRRMLIVLCVFVLCIGSVLAITQLSNRYKISTRTETLEAQNSEYLSDIETSSSLLISALKYLKASDKEIVELYDEFIPPETRPDTLWGRNKYTANRYTLVRSRLSLDNLIDKYPDFYKDIP